MRFPRHLMSLATIVAVAVLLLGFIAVAARAATPANPNCQLRVPAHPLSAAGLATPYEFSASGPAAGACDEANTDQTAFVEAAVLDPATGALSVYHPLVVNAGDVPAMAPVVPALPANAVVGIWFGSNGDTLKLVGPGSHDAVNGLHGDLFGQFSYLNAPNLFEAANRAIKQGKLVVPPLGVDKHGAVCPTVRDFSVVDQDQSDNLATAYAVIGGKLAQWKASYTDVQTKLTNGSDEGTLANRILPALGCTPFTLPSLDDPGVNVTSLVANELSAAKMQGDPVARVPLNDPMTLLGNGKGSVEKTNLYRRGVDQRPIDPKVETPAAYCTSLMAISPVRRAADQDLLVLKPSPTVGQTLDVFLEARYQASLKLLGCPTPTLVLAHPHGSDHHRDADHHGSFGHSQPF